MRRWGKMLVLFRVLWFHVCKFGVKKAQYNEPPNGKILISSQERVILETSTIIICLDDPFFMVFTGSALCFGSCYDRIFISRIVPDPYGNED